VPKNEKLSVKELRSRESQRLNPKSSSNRTKPEITGRPNELIDIKVFEHWYDNLDSASQESFYAFAEEMFSSVQVYLYARFLGYNGSITAVDDWLHRKFDKPDHLAILIDEIEKMQEDIRKLRVDIESAAVKRDVGVARIAAMQKELRSTIAQVDSFISSKDRKGLLMAGADRALRELSAIFKDDPIEGPLQEASMSVWAKLQYEE